MIIEWSLVFFTLFAGLAVGTFACVALTEWTGKAAEVRMTGAVAVLVTLAASGLSSVLHLGHPERIFGAFGHPTSGIFLEALAIGLFGLGVFFYILALRRNASAQSRRLVATISMIPALALAFAVGDSYVMASRPAWNTLLLPLLYVASAAVMGCFATAVLFARFNLAPPEKLKPATVCALIVQAVLIIAFLIHMAAAPYWEISRSASRVLYGDLAPLFWVGLVLVGLLIPAFLLQRARKDAPPRFASFGLACVLMAGVAFRAIMFLVGSGVRHFF